VYCRDKGGLDYKASIVDTTIAVNEENPEAKENGLSHICEFIEDCEHTSIGVKILHLLGTTFFPLYFKCYRQFGRYNMLVRNPSEQDLDLGFLPNQDSEISKQNISTQASKLKGSSRRSLKNYVN
jgi:hypothetical protein